MVIAPFAPAYTQGQVVAPAAAAASISINPNAKNVCLTNLGANVCYVRIGNAPIALNHSGDDDSKLSATM